MLGIEDVDMVLIEEGLYVLELGNYADFAVDKIVVLAASFVDVAEHAGVEVVRAEAELDVESSMGIAVLVPVVTLMYAVVGELMSVVVGP